MPSKISWIDFSSADRDAMLNVVDLFKEHEARDELGIGTIRDGIADYFFPGTTTIQTKARYFLFIPWIYLQLERKQISSKELHNRARNSEIALINSLVNGGETTGIIGRDARETLKRLPSNIYWNGMKTLGIHLFPGNQWQYHNSVDDYYLTKKRLLKGEDEESIFGRLNHNWHPGLPEIPENFPNNMTFRLTYNESEYLRERILTTQTDTLFAHFVKNETINLQSEYLWSLQNLNSLPEGLLEYISMARCFSELLKGASLVYNLILGELRKDDERIETYLENLKEWSDDIHSREGVLLSWVRHLDSFWSSRMLASTRTSGQTRTFIHDFAETAITSKGFKEVTSDTPLNRQLRDIVSFRERKLKGAKSRIDNRRSLELWSGAAGTGMLDYRWGITSKILADIFDGLGEK